MTKLLTIHLRSTAPRMLGSRGTPSQFVLYGLKDMCAKYDAFMQFVTIFPLKDRTKLSIEYLDDFFYMTTYMHVEKEQLKTMNYYIFVM